MKANIQVQLAEIQPPLTPNGMFANFDFTNPKH